MIRIPRPLYLLPALWLGVLSSCGFMSQAGPNKSAINQGSDDYELIPVTSRSSFSSERRKYGKADKPSAGSDRGYSEGIRHRDQLRIIMADLTESSPFYTKGQGYAFGPVEVPSDGLVDVPYVGGVGVLGRSLADASDAIEEKAKMVSKTVQVTVMRSARLQKTANVIGEVRDPGPVPLDRQGITSVDLLAVAGGPAGSEHLYRYTLRRNGRDHEFDYLGFRRSPFLVQPGDLISVAKDVRNRFFVMGALAKPTTVDFPVPHPTLADAIGSATGLNERLADPSGVFVFRNGNPNQVYTFNLKEPGVVMLMQEFPIHGQDLVFVTEAPLARWNRLISQILPSNPFFAGGLRYLGID